VTSLDGVEIKVALDLESTDRALKQIRPLRERPSARRAVRFYDTSDLRLFRDHGVILRTRETIEGNDPHETTLKVRPPGGGGALPEKPDLKGTELEWKVEADLVLGPTPIADVETAWRPAASLTGPVDRERITAADGLSREGSTVDDPDKRRKLIKRLLRKSQESLLEPILGQQSWHTLGCTGPIEASTWKLELPGIDTRVNAELWVRGESRILEFSRKVKGADAAAASVIATRLREVIIDGWKLTPMPGSKTLFALTKFAGGGAVDL
jgi:hypothetical protein